MPHNKGHKARNQPAGNKRKNFDLSSLSPEPSTARSYSMSSAPYLSSRPETHRGETYHRRGRSRNSKSLFGDSDITYNTYTSAPSECSFHREARYRKEDCLDTSYSGLPFEVITTTKIVPKSGGASSVALAAQDFEDQKGKNCDTRERYSQTDETIRSLGAQAQTICLSEPTNDHVPDGRITSQQHASIQKL